MKKRILAWLLVCLMVVGSLPVTAFAQDEAACPGYGNKHTLSNCSATKIDTVAPTCQDWGYTLYQCDSCSEYFAADFIKYGADYHKYEIVESAVAPDCVTPGAEDLYACIYCGAQKGGATVGATGHNYETVEEYGDCLEGYYKLERCSNCGDEVETSKEEGHVWNTMPEIELEPTCIADGIAIYTCTVCGITKRVVIKAECDYIDHVWELVEGYDPTCTEPGLADYYYCDICGSKAIYNENARESYIIIDDEDALIIPALGHDVVSKFKDPILPTCTEDGLDILVCARCGEHIEDVVTPALGHDFKSKLAVLIEYKEGNCYVPTTATYKCSRCDETHTFDLGLYHEWSEPKHLEPTCIKWGYHKIICKSCGIEHEDSYNIEPIGHDMTAYWEPLPATCENDGVGRHYCANGCGYSYEVVIPATGHASKHNINIIGTCSVQSAVMTVCQHTWCDGDKIESYTAEDGTVYDVRLAGEAVHLLTFKQIGLNENEHNFSEDEDGVLNDATCTEDGNGARWCKDCNEWIGFIIPALGHNYLPKIKGVEPTCVDTGLQVWVCDRCGHSYDEIIPAKGHRISEEVVVVAPTCCADGYTLHSCLDCDYTYQTDITKFVDVYPQFREDPAGNMIPYYFDSLQDAIDGGHIGLTLESVATIFREGSCTIIGLYKYICTACNSGVLVVIDGTGEGHAWVLGDEVTPADCVNNATANYACDCGATKVDEVPGTALGHIWIGHEYVEPTCTESGMMAYIQCDRCQEYKNKPAGDLEIPALGHDWVAYDYLAPTCTEDGHMAYIVCARCGEYKSKPAGDQGSDLPWYVIPALGHDMQIVDSARTTCEQFGYTHYDCVRCEHFYEDGAIADEEYICGYQPAFGHNWIPKPGAVEPTCTEPGQTAGEYCTLCRTLKTEPTEIPALGHHNAAGDELTGKCTDPEDDLCVTCGENIGHEHTYVFVREVPATCLDYGYDLWVCLWCEDYEAWNIDDTYLADHTWGAWYTSKPASFTAGGEERRDCEICDAFETRETEALTGLVYSIEYKNVLNDEYSIVNGSFVEVVISVEGKGVDVWGLNYKFIFESVYMELQNVEITTDLFELHNYNVEYDDSTKYRNGVVNFVATPAGGDAEIVIDEKIELAVLTFKVDCFNYENWVPELTDGGYIAWTGIGVAGVQALDANGNQLITVGETDRIYIQPIMDVNKDEKIDMVDAYAIYDIILGNMEYDYLESADLDQDGDVDYFDFEAIYNYILGTVSYDEIIDAIVG